MSNGRVVGDSPFDDNIVTMDWVLSFSRVKAAYDRLTLAQRFQTNDAKNRLKQLLERDKVESGRIKWASGLPSNERTDRWVVQESVRRSSAFSPDPLDAALHNFVLVSTIDASVCRTSQGRQVHIKKVGTSVRDQFEFGGDQHLGYWGLPNSFSYPNPSAGFRVNNELFRHWRQNTGLGQDFFALSKPKIVEVESSVNWIVFIKD